MGPTWGPPGPCRPQIGPMLAPRTLLSGYMLWSRHKELLCMTGLVIVLKVVFVVSPCSSIWIQWHLGNHMKYNNTTQSVIRVHNTWCVFYRYTLCVGLLDSWHYANLCCCTLQLGSHWSMDYVAVFAKRTKAPFIKRDLLMQRGRDIDNEVPLLVGCK